MTEFDKQLQVADWEGFVVRREERVLRNTDGYNPDPLLIAGDEGMFDRRDEAQIVKANKLNELIIDRAIAECVGEPLTSAEANSQGIVMKPDLSVYTSS